MTLGGVVDDQKGLVIPGEAVRGEGFDDRAQICRRQKARDPFACSGRVAVDRLTEFDREPRLAGSGAPDQPIDRDVGLVVEPQLKVGEKVLAADQRQSPGLGDEKVEFARRLARARSVAALGRRELLAAQRQSDAGGAEGQRDIVAVAGHDDAPAYVAGVNRPIAHVLPLLSRERG